MDDDVRQADVLTRDIREDIERRERELRGWMAKPPSSRNTRRTIALASALHDILLPYPREDFMDTWTTLHEFAWNHYDIADAARAIFDARDLTDAESRRHSKIRPTFGGGYERYQRGNAVQGGETGGSVSPGGNAPF